jgi:hypothetical protein
MSGSNQERARRLLVWLCRVLVGLAALLVILVVGGPWALYAVGLANVVGRPERPALSARLSPDDARVVWCALGESDPVPETLPRLTPHRFIADFVGAARAESFAQPTGLGLTSLVARRYDQDHVRSRRSLWWHWSGASMAIWLTRNWTLDELLVEAAAELRAYPPRERVRARCGELAP